MKKYSYKAINQYGHLIYLTTASELTYQEQVEDEYLVDDNYTIIQETYDTETEELIADVIMKKTNGIVQNFKKPMRSNKEPIKLKITYTNGDVEIMNRTEAIKRFDKETVHIQTYSEDQDLYIEFCVKSIERITKRSCVDKKEYQKAYREANKEILKEKAKAKASQRVKGSSTIDSNGLSDMLIRANDILN